MIIVTLVCKPEKRSPSRINTHWPTYALKAKHLTLLVESLDVKT